MKKKFLIILLILLILLSFSFVDFTFFKNKHSLKNSAPISSSNDKLFGTIERKSSEADINWYKSINFDYLVGDAPGIDSVTKKIDEIKNNFVCANDVDSLTPEQLREQNYGSDYYCNLSIEVEYTFSKNLISYVIKSTSFDGGPRSFVDFQTITYDKSGKEIFWGDLLNDKKDYSENFKLKLSAALRKSLSDLSNGEVPDEDFVDYLVSTFSFGIPFFVNSEGVNFVYTEDKIGSHIFPYIEVFIPYSELKGILKPEYLP